MLEENHFQKDSINFQCYKSDLENQTSAIFVGSFRLIFFWYVFWIKGQCHSSIQQRLDQYLGLSAYIEFEIPQQAIQIWKLGSVAGPVIQANGRLIFEDNLSSGGLLYFTT